MGPVLNVKLMDPEESHAGIHCDRHPADPISFPARKALQYYPVQQIDRSLNVVRKARFCVPDKLIVLGRPVTFFGKDGNLDLGICDYRNKPAGQDQLAC